MFDDRRAGGLARFINIPGGITAEEAKARADSGIAALSGRCHAEIDECLACLGAYLALLRGVPPHAVRDELHRLATCIVDLSGTFDRAPLSQAAFSLCRLLDVMDERGAWERAAVDVHYDAMHALNAAGLEAKHVHDVLAGLAALSGPRS